VTREEAQEAGYAWHGGGGSPLYRFASCGARVCGEGHRRALVREILEDREDADGEDAEQLDGLLEYVRASEVASPRDDTQAERLYWSVMGCPQRAGAF
jgi:hypothetical protein